MVGIVVVSHSEKIANGISELALQISPKANIKSAGGIENGKFGTSTKKIKDAINSVYSKDGVVITVDIGSTIINTEKAIKDFGDEVKILDCPLVEGTIVAAVEAGIGSDINRIISETTKVKKMVKY